MANKKFCLFSDVIRGNYDTVLAELYAASAVFSLCGFASQGGWVLSVFPAVVFPSSVQSLSARSVKKLNAGESS